MTEIDARFLAKAAIDMAVAEGWPLEIRRTGPDEWTIQCGNMSEEAKQEMPDREATP